MPLFLSLLILHEAHQCYQIHRDRVRFEESMVEIVFREVMANSSTSVIVPLCLCLLHQLSLVSVVTSLEAGYMLRKE